MTDIWPGRPFPLGATWDGSGTNFSLFSENAERVELCLFDDDDNETRVELCERTAFHWHGYLPGVGPGPALRLPRPRPLRPARGAPLQPAQAADRPVREVDRGQGPLEPRQRAARTSPPPGAGDDADLEMDDEDSAVAIPKSRRHRPAVRLGGRPPARTSPLHEMVIYEAHVKGFTKLHPEVREDLRGTYAGPGGPGGAGVPQGAGRQRRRAAARAPHRRRVVPGRARA